MKKLLKCEVCGTREQCTVHCSWEKSQKFRQKKKEDETHFASRHGHKCSIQTGINSTPLHSPFFSPQSKQVLKLHRREKQYLKKKKKKTPKH